MSQNEPTDGETLLKKRRIRMIGGLVFAAVVIGQIFVTERRVMDLRSRGFGDVVIDSTRDHAYFPLIGAILGAGLAIAAVKAIKWASRRWMR